MAQLRKEEIQCASTMANISIKDDKSPYEKFFGFPAPITPETCVNVGRIGNRIYRKCFEEQVQTKSIQMVHGRVCNEPQCTYIQCFKHEPGKPGEIIVTRNVRWEHWYHPYKYKSADSLLFTKVEGLNEKQKALLEKAIAKFFINNKNYTLIHQTRRKNPLIQI
jgi:hypothetical protein